MWRSCALGLALMLVAERGGAQQQQQSDEERIAELEQELQDLKEAARGRLSCTAEGGFLSITPIETGGDVSGYTITNVTSTDDAGLTVLEVALSDQDTDIVLPGMVVRISRGTGAADDLESDPSSPFEIQGLEDLTGGMDIWGVVGGNLLTWLFGCTFFGIVVALEKKYQCVGGDKIHEMVEQHHYLQGELKSVIQAIKGEQPGSPTPAAGGAEVAATGGMVVEGVEDMESGGLAKFALGHSAEMGKGAGVAATLMRAKKGDAQAQRMLAAQAVGAAKNLNSEEVMATATRAKEHGSEALHKVADSERTQRAIASAKEKGSEAFHKAGDAASDARKGTFGRKSGGGQSGGMKAKRGGGFEFKGKGSKPSSASKETGTKFQNPMLGRVSMSNPMSRVSPRASGDKGESLLGSELTVVDDDGED
jgi:hypothetical protein